MEVRLGQLERQMKKTASNRDEIHEENCWSYTMGPQREWRNFKKFES
jgi:hypothetical protein